MQNRSRIVVASFVALLAISSVLAGCSDEDSVSSGSSDKTTASVDAQANSDQGAGGSTESKLSPDASKFLEEAQERGKPDISPVNAGTDLKITDDVVGTGKAVAAHDTVTVHYIGASASDGVVFDNSWDRGEPTTFPLDAVISGWSEGLVGMKEGGRRTLVIPAEMAYGPNPPAGSNIAPNAALVFVVDLLSVQ